ncbi:MAG: flagellar export chaperone FlgN [Granulosicoccus sp.]
MATINRPLKAAGENSARETVMQRANQLASRLYDILAVELDVMQARRVEEVNAMTEEKRLLVDQLAQLEPAIRSHLSASDATGQMLVDDEGVLEFKERIQACQARNKNNQTLALVELGHSREALALLRSLMQLEDVTLYGAAGDLSIIREKRNLGAV